MQTGVSLSAVCNYMKYQEAADYLGISINTVRTQMGRAYKILRNSLDSKSFLNLLFLRFLK